MTDEKIIEVMENMKFHADCTDDKELIEACDGAIKAIKDNAKLKEVITNIKNDIDVLNSRKCYEAYAIERPWNEMKDKVFEIFDKYLINIRRGWHDNTGSK